MIYSFHRNNIICSCAPHLQIIHRWTLSRHYLCNVIGEQWTRSGYMCKWLIYLSLMIYGIRVDFYWMNFPFVNRAFHQCTHTFNNDARNSFRFREPVTRYSYSCHPTPVHLVMINSRKFIQSIKHKEKQMLDSNKSSTIHCGVNNNQKRWNPRERVQKLHGPATSFLPFDTCCKKC